MVDRCRGDVHHPVTSREEPDKRVTLFGDLERRTAAEALIEEAAIRKSTSSKRHIGSETKSTERRDLDPVWMLIVD